MTTLKDLKGTTIQFRDEDPVVYAGSWSSGGNMNTARSEFGGGGTQTSGMAAGGRNASLTNNNAEIYNGSSWTAIATMNTTTRGRLGAGADNEAFIAIGGQPNIVDVENWNGSAWTEIANLNTTKHATYGNVGTATAAIAVGYGSPNTTNEIWNGSSWTEVADLNTGGGDIAFFGTSTSGIVAAGNRPAQVAICESWNGSSWTEVADLNQSRENGSGAGSSNSIGIVFGGYKDGTGDLAKTESWNGSAWTEVNDLATARFASGGAGTETVALCSGGRGSDTYQSATEEWSFTPPTASIVQEGDMWFNSTSSTLKGYGKAAASTGTWASGGDLNTARYRIGGAVNATQSAGLIFGGNGSPYGQTEEYNGTAWSEQNDLNSGRYASYGGAGTQTACVTAGGYYPAGSPQYATALSETYNGTSWTEGNDLNEGRIDTATFGTSTAAVLAGGGEASGGPNTVSSVEIYDGTSWTETTNLPAVTQEMGSLGVSTAGLVFGGSVDSNPTTKNTTVEWDGTSWTAGGTYPISVRYLTGFGSSTNGIAAGGYKYPTAYSAVCNVYNGTSWSEVAELTTARLGTAGNGTSGAGFVAGGEISTGSVASTEEWNAPEANKTITVS